MISRRFVLIRFYATLDIFRLAVDALWNNRLRTGLTMLGMIIGIASVVGITAIGQGIQLATTQQIQSLGTHVLLIQPNTPTDSSVGETASLPSHTTTLTWEDAQAIAQQVTSAQAVSAFLQQFQTRVVYQNQNITTTLLGTDPAYLEIRNLHLQAGQFLSQADLKAAQPVVVLGAKVRDRLFGTAENAVGQAVRIQGERYSVIGVLSPKGAVGGIDQDDQVYIPLTNMSARIVGNTALSGVAIHGLWLQTQDEASLSAAHFQVMNLLRLRHQIYPPEPDTVQIINQASLINTFNQVAGLLTILVVSIAGISLVVGGIGIANILLVSVVERTREIGIRKAVGATNPAILYQFLAEAMMLSGMGGSIGVGLGVTIAFVATLLFHFPLVISLWSLVTGMGLAAIVGWLAGVVPAQRAARLDPIEALRSE
jgi:putative ABC transport system permease protein